MIVRLPLLLMRGYNFSADYKPTRRLYALLDKPPLTDSKGKDRGGQLSGLFAPITKMAEREKMKTILEITIVVLLNASGELDVRVKRIEVSSPAQCEKLAKGLRSHYSHNDPKKTGYKSITIECKKPEDLRRM